MGFIGQEEGTRKGFGRDSGRRGEDEREIRKRVKGERGRSGKG